MKLRQIVFRKKFNLGNYETQDIELTGELSDNDNADEKFLELKKKVLEMGAM